MELPQHVKDRIAWLQLIVNKPSCPCCLDTNRIKDAQEAQKEIDAILQCKEFIYEEEVLKEELWN
jgi:hypothetical protein